MNEYFNEYHYVTNRGDSGYCYGEDAKDAISERYLKNRYVRTVYFYKLVDVVGEPEED